MTQKIQTYCRICEPNCSLIAEVEEQQVLRLLPDKDHPIHRGFACHKGLNFNALHHDEDRLNFPQKRKNPNKNEEGQFQRISWKQSIEEISRQLNKIKAEYGNDAIAAYLGNPIGFNGSGISALYRMMRSMGTKTLFSTATQDCSNKLAASDAMFGDEWTHPVPDLKHTDYFLDIGSNPKVSHMSFVGTPNPMALLRDIKKRGGKVTFVNPRKIESATPATGDVLLIKPDTDVYFLAAVLNEIYHNKGFDQGVLKEHAQDIDGLIDFIQRYPVERVTEVTGLSAEQIRQVAHDFSQAKSASVHMSTGTNMGQSGTLCYWLVQMLSLVTGNLGKAGGNVLGGWQNNPKIKSRQQPSSPYFDTPLGEMRLIDNSLPGNRLPDFINSEESPVKALIVFAGNPLLTLSNESLLRKAFSKLELLICLDIYPNATGEMADFLLPCTDWLERQDLSRGLASTRLDPYLQYAYPVVKPKFERKPEWWITASIQQAMGLPSVLDKEDPEQDANNYIDRTLAAVGSSLEQLQSQPSATQMLPSISADKVLEVTQQYADQKIRCCPAEFDEPIALAEKYFLQKQQEPAGQLKLITRRTHYMHNSWMHNLPQFKRPKHLTNPLYINPSDATRLKLTESSAVRVYNEFGEIHATVTLDEDLREGVVAMTHGWGNQKTPKLKVAHQHPGVNANILLPTGEGSYEKISNQAFMTGVPIKLQAL